MVQARFRAPTGGPHMERQDMSESKEARERRLERERKARAAKARKTPESQTAATNKNARRLYLDTENAEGYPNRGR